MKKVLWFSNTNCGYHENLAHSNKAVTGTWMSSIKEEFTKLTELELAIAFNNNKPAEKLKCNLITYYPIFVKRKRNKLSRVLTKIFAKISWYNEIEYYMEIINDFHPDIIHVFGSEEAFGMISKYTTIPVVLSIQGNLTVYEWKYFSGISKKDLFSTVDLKNAIKFSTPLTKYRLFRKKAKREREIMKLIKYIIGRTDWDRRVAKILSPKAQYYHNDEMLRKEFYCMEDIRPILKEKLILTTISGPAVYKGLETVCMAVHLLTKMEIKFEWNLGGISDGELLRSVKRKLGNHFPRKNLNILGRLYENEIVDLFRKTNIYVMPSHIENGSIVLSEAMAFGLPVISTLAGGTSSRLTDKTDGIMIQAGDPWSMAGAILEMYNNYDIAIQYGQNARKRAMARHDPQKITNGLIDIYEKVIRDNHVCK